jgi:flagellar basal-body rod protein FlgC
MHAMAISRSALDVEWRRLEVLADNLANLNSTHTASGAPFQPMQLISGPKAGFSDYLGQDAQPTGVQVLGIEPQNVGTRLVYEPQNPDANSDGFVTYPDIDQASTMTQLIKTERAYEANLAVMNISRQMYGKALDLGRRS